MSVTYNRAWAGLSLHHPGFDTTPYAALKFAIRPGGQPLTAISVALYDASDRPIQEVDPQGYASPAADGWYLVSIPLSVLQGERRTITRVQLQEDTGQSQPTFYLDELRFTG